MPEEYVDDCMSYHICCSIFFKDTFRLPFLEMSEFKLPYLLNPVRYFVQIFKIFQTYIYFQMAGECISNSLHVSKIALSRSGLLGSDFNAYKLTCLFIYDFDWQVDS